MLLNCGVGEDSWEFLGELQERSNQSILKEISPENSLEELMLKLKLQYFGTWCEELTPWKRPWCWERLKAGGEGGNRGWDGWMASPPRWTWVWVSSGSWWWTGRPGVLQSMGLQRVGHDWVTELNWTDNSLISNSCSGYWNTNYIPTFPRELLRYSRGMFPKHIYTGPRNWVYGKWELVTNHQITTALL